MLTKVSGGSNTQFWVDSLLDFQVLKSPTVLSISKETGKTPPQVFFRFVVQQGIVPLTGTTDRLHMNDDLQVFDFELSDSQVAEIAKVTYC